MCVSYNVLIYTHDTEIMFFLILLLLLNLCPVIVRDFGNQLIQE